MNTLNTRRIAVLAATLIASTLSFHVQAETGLTRAQVKAELAEAQRTGNLPDYETGRMLNELFPSAYPQVVRAPRLPRAEVKADTVVQPTGNIEMDALLQRNAENLARGQHALDRATAAAH